MRRKDNLTAMIALLWNLKMWTATYWDSGWSIMVPPISAESEGFDRIRSRTHWGISPIMKSFNGITLP